MTGPESLPVEEARKKFADILDGTQFRSTHTEITRRGKAAGVVVPPEWYARAVEALAQEAPTPSQPSRRPEAAPAEPRRAPSKPKAAAREGRPLTDEEAQELATLARSRATDTQARKLDQDAAQVGDAYKDFTVVSSAMSMGLLTHDEVYAEPEERPAGSEEKTG